MASGAHIGRSGRRVMQIRSEPVVQVEADFRETPGRFVATWCPLLPRHGCRYVCDRIYKEKKTGRRMKRL